MTKIKTKLLWLMPLALITVLSAESMKKQNFDSYLLSFDYQARKDMKIDSKTLVQMMKEGKVQFVDIRFKEEYAAWHMAGSINIPLPDLPNNLDKLDKTKLIVTACPHKDRATIARTYLALKGFNTRYLVDGLTGLAELLRGDKAKDFMNSMEIK
ncbi:rhodanese-like domain-containing protein [Sulfurovum sp.]|uniref:rhodanese-like domain-containing protein n=1 Tax=Sulfurovum sp. TaxID=1969726 RepID=UPI0025DA0DCD|nr:rhodanese-like domain-containing protein [Sulfurovum sp.]